MLNLWDWRVRREISFYHNPINLINEQFSNRIGSELSDDSGEEGRFLQLSPKDGAPKSGANRGLGSKGVVG